MTTNREEAMTTREHAVDPSTLDPEQWVEIEEPDGDGWYKRATRAKYVKDYREGTRIVAVLHRADECPPAAVAGLVVSEDGDLLNWRGRNFVPQAAEQWRQVTPEEVQEGWLVERRERWTWGTGGYVEATFWTNEPADPTAERRRLIEAATGLNAETLEANLAECGLAIVRAEEVSDAD